MTEQYHPERAMPDEEVQAPVVDESAYTDMQQAQHLLLKRAILPEQLPPLESIIGHYDELGATLKSRVIGQDSAMDAIITALDRRHARVDEKPIAALLFIGPTGVGKTETSKALLEGFRDMGMKANIVRVDCASLSSRHDAAAYLLGSPAGYIGYKDPPALDAANFANPYREEVTILVLDEIEKAASDLYKVLLPILDEGRVSLRNGESTSFANTIVIATSNVGASEMNKLMSEPLGFIKEQVSLDRNHDAITSAALRGLKEHFKAMPEFLGRFGAPIVFRAHDKQSLYRVLDSAIEARNEELTDRHGVEIYLTQAVKDKLVAEALPQSHLGARPLIHALEDHILSAVGRYLGAGYISEGYRLWVHHSSELGKADEDKFVFSSERDESLTIYWAPELDDVETEDTQEAPVDDEDEGLRDDSQS